MAWSSWRGDGLSKDTTANRRIIAARALFVPPPAHRPTGRATGVTGGRQRPRLVLRPGRQAQLPGQFPAVTLRALRLLAAEDQGLEGFLALLTDVLVKRH